MSTFETYIETYKRLLAKRHEMLSNCVRATDKEVNAYNAEIAATNAMRETLAKEGRGMRMKLLRAEIAASKATCPIHSGGSGTVRRIGGSF